MNRVQGERAPLRARYDENRGMLLIMEKYHRPVGVRGVVSRWWCWWCGAGRGDRGIVRGTVDVQRRTRAGTPLRPAHSDCQLSVTWLLFTLPLLPAYIVSKATHRFSSSVLCVTSSLKSARIHVHHPLPFLSPSPLLLSLFLNSSRYPVFYTHQIFRIPSHYQPQTLS